MVLVLGIESTCDETACAVVKDGKEILANCVASQIEIHSPFGGVVPELASRHHVETIIPLLHETLRESSLSLEDIDAIAVANGPGLIGAILVGLNTAKALAMALDKPLLGVNHIEAHLYAALMEQASALELPALGLVISGGHTALIQVEDVGHYKLLGQTIDDAIGEAFDKTAALLELPYPGGPQIEALAKKGNPKAYPFQAGKVKERPLDFSFSGLKTKVLYTLKGPNSDKNAPLIISEEEKANVAASFQEAAFKDLIEKVVRAYQMYPCNSLLIGGGVANSRTLRKMFDEANLPFPILWPPGGLSLDNAAMIAGLGFSHFQTAPQGHGLEIEAFTRHKF